MTAVVRCAVGAQADPAAQAHPDSKNPDVGVGPVGGGGHRRLALLQPAVD